MTTLNNDELRGWLDKVIDGAMEKLQPVIDHERVTSDMRVALARDMLRINFLNIIATRDQQLLEAILKGAIYTGDPNGVHRDARGQVSAINLVQAVPVEHIKSVFEGKK